VRGNFRRGLSAVVVAVVAAAGLGGGPSAEATAGGRLEQLLANNPGSIVTGPDSITTPSGVTLSLAAAKAGASVDDLCTYEHLCLYSEQVYKGEKLTIDLDCKLYYLWDKKMSDGTSWNGRVASYINNQKAGTWAHLWWNLGSQQAPDGKNWVLVESSKARGKGLNRGVDQTPHAPMSIGHINLVRPCTATP
jgi:hypothetical protein